MAERRMFAKTIIDSDAFLTLPLSSQALYFHLSMRGDDEGFVNKPRAIMKTIGANDDDMSLLIAKNFIIPFESGIVVIKHWKMHNYIQNDRRKDTVYVDEKKLLKIKDNKSYSLDEGRPLECIQSASKMDRQVSIGKVSIGKIKYSEFVYLAKDEYDKLITEYGDAKTTEFITMLDNYKGSSGKEYKSDYRAILSWVVDRCNKNKQTKNNIPQHNNFKQRDSTNENYDKFYEKL